jgi:uncharacterized protein with HEPN domain
MRRRAPPRAVAFRNLLIHGYATVDDATVWRIVTEDVPVLAGRLDRLMVTDPQA